MRKLFHCIGIPRMYHHRDLFAERSNQISDSFRQAICAVICTGITKGDKNDIRVFCCCYADFFNLSAIREFADC